MKLEFTEETLRYMSLFEAAVNTYPKDCIVFDDVVYFIVAEGDLKKVLENHGENIRKLKRLLNKNIIVVEHSNDTKKFIKNMFGKINIKRIDVEEKNSKILVKIYIDPRDKPLAIGKDGKNLNRIKEIMKRYYDISSIVII